MAVAGCFKTQNTPTVPQPAGMQHNDAVGRIVRFSAGLAKTHNIVTIINSIIERLG